MCLEKHKTNLQTNLSSACILVKRRKDFAIILRNWGIYSYTKTDLCLDFVVHILEQGFAGFGISHFKGEIKKSNHTRI